MTARKKLLISWFIALVAIGIRLVSGPHPIDDAYITFRYARNLAEGHGLVYNPGERVLGTSTPLYALVLASLAAGLGADRLPHYALWVNAISGGVASILVFRLASKLGLAPLTAGLTGMLQALSPLSIRYALGGMEICLTTALLLGSYSAHLEGRNIWRAIFGTIVVFSRLDAALAIALFIAFELLRNRRIPWTTLGMVAAAIIPAAIAAEIAYGSALPQSVLAKSTSVYQSPVQTNAFQFAYHFGGLIMGPAVGISAKGNFLIPSELQSLLAWALLIPQATLWIVGAIAAIRLDSRWAAFFAFAPAYVLIYSVLGLMGSLVAEWYMPALFPFYILGIAFGVRRFFGLLEYRGWRAGSSVVLGLFLAAELAGLNLGRKPAAGWWVPRSVLVEREALYQEAAARFLSDLEANSTVAAPEIGALGYYCDCRIFDTVGLVSPSALRYYPVPVEAVVAIYAVPSELIRDTTPEYLVSLEVFIRRTLLDDEWFLTNYRRIGRLETTAFASDGLLIFERTW